APARSFGDFNDTDVTITGAAAAVALGIFNVAGNVSRSSFDIPQSVTTFKVAGGVGGGTGTQIAAGFAADPGITTLSLASILLSTVTTRHIGTFSVSG